MPHKFLRITNFDRITNYEFVIRNSGSFVIRRVARERFVIRREAPERAGQAVLTTVIFLLLTSTALTASFASIALTEARSGRADLRAKQTYFLAEAGVEDVVYRMKNAKSYDSSETVSLGGTSATVAVSGTGQTRTVQSTGDVANAIRRVEVTVKTGTGVSFTYGIHVGRGGLRMENSSTVNGSIYSHGDVYGGGTGDISGDVFVATTHEIHDSPDIGGQAQAHRIRNVRIAGNATSSTALDASTVGAHAYADTFATSTSVTGTCFYRTSVSANTTCGAKVQVASVAANLPELPFPITDSHIADWETAAAAGGTHTSPCPYTLTSGTTTIGPRKINCDFTIQNTATVIVTGPIWVVGDLDIKNSGILRLAASYGSGSEVVIVDNQSNRTTSSEINVQNFGDVLGSGTVGSYLALMSQNNSAELGGNEVAIRVHNNAEGGIFYALHGRLQISNAITLKEAVAYVIHMLNNATLTYEQGLTSVTFTSGPTGGWNIQGWKEVP